MKKTILSTALIAVLALGAYALFNHYAISQNTPMNHKGMDHSMMSGKEGMAGMAGMGTPKGDQGPSSIAYAKANATMHTGMDIEFTGNADVDFAAGMIPHHEGAVAMAKIVLAHGKDPELRKLAEAVVAAQESEIIFMREWLRKNAK